LPGFAAIRRQPSRISAHEKFLVIHRVHTDLAEVHRTVVLVADKVPGTAAVVGTIDAAAIGIGRRRGSPASSATATAAAALRRRRSLGALRRGRSTSAARRTAFRR